MYPSNQTSPAEQTNNITETADRWRYKQQTHIKTDNACTYLQIRFHTHINNLNLPADGGVLLLADAVSKLLDFTNISLRFSSCVSSF